MSESIGTTHVSGPLGQALAVVDGETWLYQSGRERRRPSANDIRFFFDFGLEVRPVAALETASRGGDGLSAVLDAETRRFRALQGLLVGMDSELDDDVRQRGMRRSEGLLGEPPIAAFVETRFLRPVDGQPWSVPQALSIAHEAGLRRVERLYAIVDGPWLLGVEAKVREWAAGQQSTSVARALVVQRAYENGLIAAVATAAHDRDRARVQRLVFMARGAAWDPRLVAHLVNFAAPRQAVPAATGPEQDDVEMPVRSADGPIARARAMVEEALEVHHSRRSRDTRRPHGGGASDLDAILKQVAWIAAQFQAGNHGGAWGAVGDLAQRQISHGGAAYLAQSLTNIATQLAGRVADAEALLELAALCAPDDPTVWTANANLLMKSGRLPEALAAYDSTVERFPDDVFARTGRAETLRALGRLPEALAAYDSTVERFPDDVFARTGRAEALRALGRLPEALAAYDRTVEQFPDNVVARNGRAETLRALGRLPEALAAYDRTVEQFPDDVVARTGRAETLRALGRLPEALAAYDRTVERFPDNVVARNGRAETLRALGRLPEALAAYDRTVEQFPDNVVARNGRATVLVGLGRTDEARLLLEPAGSKPVTRGDWVAVHILCMIDLRAGASPALADRLRRLVLACPYPSQQRYFETTLAVVQLALRDPAEARKEVGSLLARADFEPGERQVLHLMQAHAAAADGDLDAARQSLAAASNVVPYEQFAARQLRSEIERRYGLGTQRALTGGEEIAASEEKIIWLEADAWGTRAAEVAQAERRVA